MGISKGSTNNRHVNTPLFAGQTRVFFEIRTEFPIPRSPASKFTKAAIPEPPLAIAAEMVQTAAVTFSEQGSDFRASVNLITQVDAHAEPLSTAMGN